MTTRREAAPRAASPAHANGTTHRPDEDTSDDFEVEDLGECECASPVTNFEEDPPWCRRCGCGTVLRIPGPDPRKLRAELLDVGALAQLPPMQWLLDGMLLLDSIALLPGKPGSAKSFVALDWALSIATGTDWVGHHSERGAVVYCAGEGIAGLPRRVQAWQSAHKGVRVIGFDVLPRVVNLLDDQDVSTFCEALAPLRPHLVVIDPLARSMLGGDENSAKDMGHAVENLARVRRATGACVLVIHHIGRSGTNPRGSSALDAGVDTIVRVTKDGPTVRLINARQKDDQGFADVVLTLTPRADSVVLTDYDPNTDDLSEDAFAMLRALDEVAGSAGVSTTVWKAAAPVAERTFYRWRKRLEELNLTASVGSGRGSHHSLTIVGRQRLHG